jgi:hypothetical protein
MMRITEQKTKSTGKDGYAKLTVSIKDIFLSKIKYHIMRSLATIVLSLFSLVISAQTTFEKIVTRNSVYHLNSVIQTADGGFAAMGFFNAPYIDSKWLVKTDAIGDTLWSKSYTGNDNYSGDRYFSETPDGGFTFLSNRSGKVRLVHVDDAGNSLWDKELFYGSSNAMFRTTGGYIIAAYATEDTLQHDCLIICKVNDSGDISWLNHYLEDPDYTWESTYPQSIRETRQGGLIVAGNFNDYNWNHTPFLFNIGPTGDSLWFKTYSISGNNKFYSVDTTSDGGFIASGYITQNTTAFTLKVDDAGDTLWTNKNFSMVGYQSFYSVRATADGGAVACGESSTNDYQGPDTNKVYLVKYSSGGTIDWERKITTSGDAAGYCIDRTTDNGYIVCGLIQPYAAMGGGLLIKTDASGKFTGTDEKDMLPGCRVFPNPASDRITFSFPEGTKLAGTVTFYNLCGEEVYKTDVLKGQTKMTVETGSWKPGLFLYVISDGNKTLTGKICISGKGN